MNYQVHRIQHSDGGCVPVLLSEHATYLEALQHRDQQRQRLRDRSIYVTDAYGYPLADTNP
ncbi:hypothetical protein [Haloechinothrix sp. LS1_15]|uniref:hypothetical protein n=1 Tax=Haloechinothrix sp. LS1_15 TaxID=2652248 RepID=UPI00294596C1|nr:hypothetical protein [Haloechinothrix sp. LS1_15]MDV6012295.1 hypothetical protein [Haloechinothrix sp. LS1_15]